MIKSIFKIWTFYWILLIILPLETINNSILSAFLIQLTFPVFFSVGFLSLEKRTDFNPSFEFNSAKYRSTVNLTILLAIIGALLLSIDRLPHLTENNFNLSLLRDLLKIRNDNNSINSYWSFYGSILLSVVYLPIIVILHNKKKYSLPFNKIKFLICIFLVLFLAISIGGRVPVIILIALSFFHFKKLIFNKFVIIFLISIFLYSLIIFDLRVERSLSYDYYQYFDKFMEIFNLQPMYNFKDVIVLKFLLLITYFTHSFSILTYLVDNNITNENGIFTSLQIYLSKINFIGLNLNNSVPGVLKSLPGQIYQTFGYIYLPLISYIFGSYCGYIVHKSYRKFSILIYFLHCINLSIIFLSPYIFIFDYYIFPSFFIISLLSIFFISLIYGFKQVKK